MAHEAAYEIRATTSIVEFWVSTRLPFEPRGVMRSARDELRQAISGLSRPPELRLIAEYVSRVTQFVDVENVLLYNVGTGVFSNASAGGLHVRRNYEVPVASPTARQFEHYHRYAFEAAECSPSAAPASTFSLCRMTTETKPHDVWWAMCSGNSSPRPAVAGRFRLDIELPNQGRNLAAIAKPLLDGVICAMHPASAFDREAIRRLSTKASWPDTVVKRHLEHPPLPVLKPRMVLNVYRDFVKWDPADELCDEFVISLVSESKRCRVWIQKSH